MNNRDPNSFKFILTKRLLQFLSLLIQGHSSPMKRQLAFWDINQLFCCSNVTVINKFTTNYRWLSMALWTLMVNFSPGWNFAPPTGLKYCCDYMLNFSPGAKLKFPWESLLRFENTIDTHARAPFSAWADKMIAITWIFQPVWPGWKSYPGLRIPG